MGKDKISVTLEDKIYFIKNNYDFKKILFMNSNIFRDYKMNYSLIN